MLVAVDDSSCVQYRRQAPWPANASTGLPPDLHLASACELPAICCACSAHYLNALAHGCWVLSYAYLSACLDAGQWLPEKPYQAWVSSGWDGCSGIPPVSLFTLAL